MKARQMMTAAAALAIALGATAGTEEYTAEGLPFAKKGIPNAEVVFAAGRTAVNLAAHGGLSEIRYFGEQGIGEAKLFRGSPISVFNQLFRPYANFGGSDQYFLPFNETSFWPFGYDSSCTLKDVKFRHRFTVLPDALVWELETVDGRYPAFSLKSALTTCAAPIRREGRTFARFAFDGTRGVGSFAEKGGQKEFFATAASAPQAHFAVPINHLKDYFTVAATNGYAAFAVVFGTDEAKTRSRAAELDRTAKAECAAARAAFRADQAAGTQVRTGHKVLDSFLANAWGNVQSMRVRDLKGGYLASNYCYWIWGWDSMAHCDALGLMGHADDLYDRLCFYRDNATADGDIPHAFNLQGKSTVAMHTAPQTIYTIMLYDYYLYSRDKARTLEFYDFAAKRLDATEKDYVAAAGLYKGMSLYPDYPPDLGQTGDDLCSFDNSILFQAFRAMARLAVEFDKTDDAKRWTARADSLKTAFLKRFWDPERQAFYDSLDATTLVPRRYYPVYAVLALSPYAWELTEGVEREYARYLLANHREKNGVTMFARKDPVFYSDGVQLGMYMAVIEREFRRLEAKYGRGDSVLPVIERNWRAVEVAEAACMEAVNMNEFTSDAPGKKQQFAINSWYAQSFEVLGGLGFSVDALTVLSSSVDRGGWTYRNLRLGKGVLDVVFTGKGRHVAALTLDGKPVAGVSVPMKDLVVGRHEVKVALSEVDGLRFNHLYSSHMVLQRGEPIRLAGFAPAGRRVSVTFKDVTKETTADQANAWAVTFPAEQAGGPYAFVAKDGVSAVTLDDVMVGDVWFCTGQSNMWWPMCRSGEAEKEIAAANHPNIRLLDVALTGAAEEVGEPPYVRGWSRCTPETVRNFSACGYHFARTVREKLGDVAIGLVGAGWGGPPISHFLPCAKPSGAYAELAREALAASAEGFADEDRLRALCRDFLGSDARLAAYANGPTEPGASVKVTLPCKRGLEHTVLKNFSGVALFRRTVEVPDAWIGQDLVVELGSTTLPSAVLVNGVCVGRTKDWDAPVPGDVGSVPNRCVVKATDVRKGANEICAFLGCNERLSWWSGFYGELKLMPKDRPEVSVSLAGDTWTCEKAITVPETGRTYGGSWCARIHPFFQLPVKGVLFYQGEADSKRPAADYLKDQKLLISLLRQGWQKPTLPYYCMQLANHARKRNGENGFCEIREAQRLTAEEVPFTGTACSIDVGEDLNIHPLNKREQGRRLALQALKKTYGCADVVADGPSFLKLERTGKTATVVYKPSSAKLVLKGEKLTGFEACAKDGAWQAVEAELAGDRVKLTAPFEIAHVRYLWQNFPEPGAVLFDDTGLPAVPFRSCGK